MASRTLSLLPLGEMWRPWVWRFVTLKPIVGLAHFPSFISISMPGSGGSFIGDRLSRPLEPRAIGEQASFHVGIGCFRQEELQERTFSGASHGDRIQKQSQKLRSGTDKETSPTFQRRSTLAQSPPPAYGEQESSTCQKGQQRRIQKGLDDMALAARDRFEFVATL